MSEEREGCRLQAPQKVEGEQYWSWTSEDGQNPDRYCEPREWKEQGWSRTQGGFAGGTKVEFPWEKDWQSRLGQGEHKPTLWAAFKVSSPL